MKFGKKEWRLIGFFILYVILTFVFYNTRSSISGVAGSRSVFFGDIPFFLPIWIIIAIIVTVIYVVTKMKK